MLGLREDVGTKRVEGWKNAETCWISKWMEKNQEALWVSVAATYLLKYENEENPAYAASTEFGAALKKNFDRYTIQTSPNDSVVSDLWDQILGAVDWEGLAEGWLDAETWG